MSKLIITIGVQIPGSEATHVSLKSKISILDYDIAVIDPNISDFYGFGDEDYLGKHCLSDNNSFQLKEHLEHWKQEILEALKVGKTVFILLNSLQEVFVATGERTYSGTGRGQKTTRHVNSCINYKFVPGIVEFRSAEGSSMRLAEKNNALGHIPIKKIPKRADL